MPPAPELSLRLLGPARSDAGWSVAAEHVSKCVWFLTVQAPSGKKREIRCELSPDSADRDEAVLSAMHRKAQVAVAALESNKGADPPLLPRRFS